MRLDWTDLRIFLHVCEAGSMTGAAARCHLTLAAVSARIRSLEESSGIVLLDRQARGVTPTAAGEVLAAHARVVFGQLQQLERDLLHRGGGTAPRLVLLANSAALARPLADALAAPEHGSLLVRESASEATVQALLSGAADVGIVSDAVATRGLVAVDLGPDPLMAVVPATHPLARRARVRFDEVLGEPWITWGEQSALSTHLQLRAVASGHRIQPRITYPRLDGVLRLVARGLGVTILPEALLAAHRGGGPIAHLALEDPWANRRLLACHVAGDDPAREQLAQAIAGLWRGGTN